MKHQPREARRPRSLKWPGKMIWPSLAAAFALAAPGAAVRAQTRVWPGAAVPEPRPATGPVQVGVYIFPGWYRDKGRGDYPYYTHDEDSEWRLIARCPKPRPLLGFYDDSLPEVNDWHIKWALEHGISFFAFDWYWNAGEHRLLRTLERGFLKARYANMMKFCIHWCNHGLDWRTRQWYPLMGLADAHVENGALVARATTGDPAFACPVRIEAKDYKSLIVRMSIDRGNRGQFFWGGAGNPVSERNSLSFDLVPDARVHEYVLDLASVPAWTGNINQLRLDPTAGPAGAAVRLDSLRLVPAVPGKARALHWEFNDAASFNSLTPAGLDLTARALLEMTDYLAKHYFHRANYLTVHGRPVFMIWDPRAVIRANGGPEGFKRVLWKMNARLRRNGIRPMYLISLRPGDDIEAAGFDAITGYGYYGADFDAPYEWGAGAGIPYALNVRHYESVWRSVSSLVHVPYLLPIGTSWDSRPRHGKRAAVIFGKTPELFRTLCRNSLKYVDRRLNMVIIEAWNEWGEGSFLEPDRDSGFAYLDVVREVFTNAPPEHVDYVPPPAKIAAFSVLSPQERARAAEIAKLPYPPPPLRKRSVQWEIDRPLPNAPILERWEFNAATAKNWRLGGFQDAAVAKGLLTAAVATGDPQWIAGKVGVQIENIHRIAFRLRVSGNTPAPRSGEIFWATEKAPSLSAGKSFRFALPQDGRWHTIQVYRRLGGKWTGTLKVLRLDIGSPGNKVELDWIRLYGRPQPE